MHRTYTHLLMRPVAALLIAASSLAPMAAMVHADDEGDVASLPADEMPMDVTSPADAASPAFMPVVNTATVTSPEYGPSMFLWGHRDSTGGDLAPATTDGVGCQQALLQWRDI